MFSLASAAEALYGTQSTDTTSVAEVDGLPAEGASQSQSNATLLGSATHLLGEDQSAETALPTEEVPESEGKADHSDEESSADTETVPTIQRMRITRRPKYHFPYTRVEIVTPYP